MAPNPLLRRRTLVTTALGSAVLAACSSTPERTPDGSVTETAASDGGGTPTATGTPPADPSTAFTTVSLFWGRSEVTVGVRPLVRTGDYLVLTLDLSTEDPHGDVSRDLISHFDWVWGSSEGTWRGARLLDLTGDVVATPATEDGVRTVMNGTDTSPHDGENALEGSIQLVYGDLGTDEVAVYLPKVPLIAAVPVLEGDPPELDPDEGALDLTEVDAAPLAPMQSLSVDLLEPILEQADAESVTVSIGSDVLFDSSSAELSDKAQDVLDDAAARIGSHEPGPVTIVGHTDDVDDEEFNLDLSRRRAEAVAQALASRIDTTTYPLTTAGRGESEPIADNSTEEGRARNRRVELEITAPRRAEEQMVPEELPPFDGRVSSGQEGLLFDGGMRPFRLRALGARFVSEHLMVTLEAVCEDDEVDSVYGLGGFSKLPGYWGTIAWRNTDGAIGVLTGSTMTAPVFHDPGKEEDELVPLTDLYTPSRIDGGVPRVLELIYPRTITGIAPGGTVTLQHGHRGFRLTDIPVES